MRHDIITVCIDVGPHSAVLKVWFDNDIPSWKMSLDRGRGGILGDDARGIVERMQTASVLHYQYTSTELPPGGNTDIPVDSFAQVWKDTQAFFAQGWEEERRKQ
jgi:hypothetical protein